MENNMNGSADESAIEKTEGTEEQQQNGNMEMVGNNVETILKLHSADEKNVENTQRFLETISKAIERPMFFVACCVFVLFWVAVNTLGKRIGIHAFDPPPFSSLQGIVSFGSLLIMIIVLIKQNRQAINEKRQSHLELQVNLLTEQKVTKLIQLIEELRRDLPIQDRHDPESAALQIRMHPQSVLNAIDKVMDKRK